MSNKRRLILLVTTVAVGLPWLLASKADVVGDMNVNRITISSAVPSTTEPATEINQGNVAPSKDLAIDHSPLDETSAVPVQESVVNFAEELNIPSTESGLIAELNVSVGAAVKWGEPIARLDDRAYRIRSRAASLRLDSAMQQINDDLELQYAEKALQEAEAELESSRSIYQDSAGAIPLTTIRRQRLSVERAQLDVARAKKAASLAKTEVELRGADLASIEETIRRLHLQSPLTGVVLQVFRQRGEWVNAGEPVVRVARLDRLDVIALLSAEQLPPQMCRDRSVSVRWVDPVSHSTHRLRGRVSSVQPQRLADSRYRIQATIANERTADAQDWLLHPGTEVQMFVYPDSATK